MAVMTTMADTPIFAPFTPPFEYDRHTGTVFDSQQQPVLKMEVLKTIGLVMDSSAAFEREVSIGTEIAVLMNEKHQESLRFTNFYKCSECGYKWHSRWSCTCNDRCPSCNTEIEPTNSVENEDSSPRHPNGNPRPAVQGVG